MPDTKKHSRSTPQTLAAGIPRELHEEILVLRCTQGLTWKQISRLVPAMRGWKLVRAARAKRFPRRQIAAADLQHWYNLHILRVQHQMHANTRAARQLAARSAKQERVIIPQSATLLQEALEGLRGNNKQKMDHALSAVNRAVYEAQRQYQEIASIENISRLFIREFFLPKKGTRTA